jgi:hypothetical protein
MNLPRFTGEASLYQTSGQYRTGRHASSFRTPMISGIYPSRDEVIEIHSCPPGWTDYGGTCFPDPLTEPSSGSGTSSGGPGGGGQGGVPGPGGTGSEQTPQPHTTPKPKRYKPEKGKPCYVERSVTSGGVTITDEIFEGKYVTNADDKWMCDNSEESKIEFCPSKTYTDWPSKGYETVTHCYNGKSPW